MSGCVHGEREGRSVNGKVRARGMTADKRVNYFEGCRVRIEETACAVFGPPPAPSATRDKVPVFRAN